MGNALAIRPLSPDPVFPCPLTPLTPLTPIPRLPSQWREPPRDALDTMVLGSADLDECDRYKQTNFVPFDPTTKRTEATVVSPEGETFQVAKGAPQRILALLGEGEAKVAEQVEVAVKDFAARGIRCLAVARTDDHGDWRVAGLLTFLDPPREDTKAREAWRW